MVRLAFLALGVVTLMATGNCSKSDPRPTDTAPPRETARGAAKAGPNIQLAEPAPEGAAGPVAGGGGGEADPGDQSFKVTAEQPAPAAVGAETVARLVVQPGSGYKMNKDFPTKLTLEPPAGVTLPKAVLEPADAEHFSEKELAFAVKMSAPAAGEYTIPGTLKFAVCTDTTCDPKKRKVALVLKAN